MPADNTTQTINAATQAETSPSGSVGSKGGGASQSSATYETFDAFLSAQPPEIRDLYTSHVSGLTSALKSERSRGSDLEKQLRDAAKKADRGSDLEKELNARADELAQTRLQTTFYEKAHAAGIRNLSLAFIAARQSGLVDDRGECDYTKLKTQFPELFSAPVPATPPGSPGSGTGRAPTDNLSMNDRIRRAAGR